MTSRLNIFAAASDHDDRVDDLESLVTAIKQVRGVIETQPGLGDPDEFHKTSKMLITLVGAIRNDGVDKVLHALENID